ncbi:response regulator [Pelagibacterium sediminicola]|uniref:response regulator n=1 Tax=Pelagibacterium sediminicola TaxID=2248761 RepID=UPI000E30E345|nr:response regulator [Pelagibacterium sediminicola]
MKTTYTGGAVLVVEDDPLVRLDTALALSDAGFAVIEAGTADEAIDILAERRHIGLVFTDIETPGRHDGLDLARMVAETRPDLPVLVTSGQRRAGGLDPRRFFAKPYDTRAVIARARALTARRRKGLNA